MTIFTKEELIQFNDVLLCRGEPTQQDGIGYNKADYGTCSNYYYGLSDAQIADLAKRLVKYTVTQLKVDKEVMKETEKHFRFLAGHKDRNNGVSIIMKEKNTLIGFRYNEEFINIIRKQPRRMYDRTVKSWIIPNECIISALTALKHADADVDNAIEYAKKILNIA